MSCFYLLYYLFGLQPVPQKCALYKLLYTVLALVPKLPTEVWQTTKLWVKIYAQEIIWKKLKINTHFGQKKKVFFTSYGISIYGTTTKTNWEQILLQ